MENVKGILTIQHDKPTLTDEERAIADRYYILESQRQELLEKRKALTIKKDTDKEELEKVIRDLQVANIELKSRMKDIVKFRMNVTDVIKSDFEELGYDVEIKLLNAVNYGVPQKRERVIFIGYRNDLKMKGKIDYPTETHSQFGDDGKLPWVSVRDAIDDLKDAPEDKEGLQHIYTTHTPAFTEKIVATPIGHSVNPDYGEAFYRCPPDSPSNTVKENHGGVFIHYEKNRVMTPRELARLQSFPDSFVFKGSKSCILVQIGNAVPCKLGEAVAGVVKKALALTHV